MVEKKDNQKNKNRWKKKDFFHHAIRLVIASQNFSSEKSCALIIACSDSSFHNFSSFAKRVVFPNNSWSELQSKPFFSSVTISFCPPLLITVGTTPAPIASTVVIPKCSASSGCFSTSSPYPDACQ